MPLQNRVTPLGDIIATPHRGRFTGNRGIIHDPRTRTLLRRRWTSKAWIVCTCDFRGRRRDVMGTQSWTELFFLDEATALAAGHRPCFFCRRSEANAFRAAWAEGRGVSNPRASEIDAVLHEERLSSRAKRLHDLPSALDAMPDGAMVKSGSDCLLMVGGQPLLWSAAGYRPVTDVLDNVLLVTPPSTLRALHAGYRPVLHPSAMGSP